MIKTIAIAIAMLSACTESGSTPEPDASVDPCGPAPLDPSPFLWAEYTQPDGSVVFSAADIAKVHVFRDQAVNWMTCRQER